ncbi:phenylacetate--CoA ligase family protein [Roseateles sp.]|uniref:phenylacetate--CoA ligase family protein n=1 Tax=Roseateles sp. TaxID=1971397 RepID=UPI0039DF5398
MNKNFCAARDAGFCDPLEIADPDERERALMAALPAQIQHAKAAAPAFAELFAGIDAAGVNSRAALARLPVTRKAELQARQQRLRCTDAFGGYSAIGWAARGGRGAKRVFQSPGGVYEPQGQGADYWRVARALFAAGVRAGDLLHNSFSYHLTPAGSMMEGGAHALGCTVFPAGVGNTELQLQAINDLRPQAYVGTPSFLRILLEKATELGVPTASLSKALLSGEAFTPSLRDWFLARGVAAYQCYASADLGLIAYETSAREGLVLAEGLIVEIVRPGTAEPLPDGEVGELVVTSFNPDYPLIRFGTGDLSAVLPGRCPTGRSNTRIKGWLGRADQSVKVRGMFVHAAQVAEIMRRFPALGRARLVVEGALAQDRMSLHIEAQAMAAVEGLSEQIEATIREVTKLRSEVVWAAPGSLANDGLVIEDARSYH